MKCVIHGERAGGDGSTCSKCKSCTHQTFWMSDGDFKRGRFRCNGCGKVFKAVPADKEVWVLLNGSWVDYYKLIEKPKEEMDATLAEITEVRLSVCQMCGTEYESENITSKFCSANCRVKSSRRKTP